MEIFITLSKYNTRRQREEGNPDLVVNYLVNILPTPIITVSNVFMMIGTYPLIFMGTVYKKRKCDSDTNYN